MIDDSMERQHRAMVLATRENRAELHRIRRSLDRNIATAMRLSMFHQRALYEIEKEQEVSE